MSVIRYVGLDVHAESTAVAVADSGGKGCTFVGKVPSPSDSVLKAVKKLGKPGTVKVAYEAGPTGFGLYRRLVAAGYECHVVAPTLIPVKAGDRVKTDRRDAEKLARCLRSGDLTDAWVPTVETEAMRDLVRCREAAVQDQLRARHRLSKFLLRNGMRRPSTMKKAWTGVHLVWLSKQELTEAAQQAVFDDLLAEVNHQSERLVSLEKKIEDQVPELPEVLRETIRALQSMRGIALVSAATLATEVEQFGRFEHPRQLMSYAGLVPSENSSGDRTNRGGITKTGNARLRRVLVETAWNSRGKPKMSYALKKRQYEDPRVREIAWKAQKRLHARYLRLSLKGKTHNKVLIAIARETLAFVWEIGKTVEHACTVKTRRQKVAA